MKKHDIRKKEIRLPDGRYLIFYSFIEKKAKAGGGNPCLK
jgi:hypothetical protein